MNNLTEAEIAKINEAFDKAFDKYLEAELAKIDIRQ